MRLLEYNDDGEFSLTEDIVSGEIPPYAILSHTWEADTEEVTYADLIDGTEKNKHGYKKIRFCGEQARRDGLQYFWVDTCCINKSSSVELTVAINSMFRWYRNATKCYVYLSDVSLHNSVGSDLLDFRRSRWFSRGWTLPELLAPRSIEFFSQEGNRLGNKDSLLQEIHDITGIAIPALQGSPLSDFSAIERMSWADRRWTALEEDAAYCLLGIFNVHMPLIYGEGRENALVRLWREMSMVDHRSTTSKLKTKIDEIRGADSNAGSDTASIFSDGGISASSASTASLNPVQTTGIREVSRALLSQEDLKALCTTAVQNIGRWKARAPVRGFLKEYGRNLLKEASDRSLEIQAAKFVQKLAGRISDEVGWSITGFKEVSLPLETGLARKGLESWLSSLQPQSVDVTATVEETFEGDDSDEELDNGLQFPNIDKVKDFLLNSEAFGTLVTTMRTWLEVDIDHSGDVEKPKPGMSEILEEPAANTSAYTDTEEVTEEMPAGLIDLHQDVAQEPDSRSILRQNRGSVSDLLSGILDFWGISFFFYDLVEFFVPRVRPGYKRLRWRCSCNTILWGDFAIDDDHTLNQLRQELSGYSVPLTQRTPSSGASTSRPNTESGVIHLGPVHSIEPSSGLGGVTPADLSSPNLTDVSGSSPSMATRIVNIAFSPIYFEVCINIGNYAIDHHEIDISQVVSDSELFELIWDKYNSSRGIGLRRLFLRPRNVHFVMFSISRNTQYGAGIHKKPDEFPPQTELNKKRYHYLCPKIQMPVNVFLHYLHRARWNVWGEHAEDTWLQRLPKKLNESVLAKVQQDDAVNQQEAQEAQEEQVSTIDPNLAFGWGVHILDGPNHAVLGVLIAIGVVVAFVISGMVVGFAKTQEQGFGVGSFLLAILASIMAAVYFQLQDQ